MEITDVRLRLVRSPSSPLKAYCTITLEDAFVVRDLKVVEGANGLFVAMPSRKVMIPCVTCGYKNPVRANFCNECGTRIDPNAGERDPNGRERLHQDIAHPINSTVREQVQQRVIEAYLAEIEGGGTAAEGEPEGEVEEREESVSEYDALIADLRKGAPERAPAYAGRPQHGPRRDGGPGGHERRDDRRDDRRGGGDRGRGRGEGRDNRRGQGASGPGGRGGHRGHGGRGPGAFSDRPQRTEERAPATHLTPAPAARQAYPPPEAEQEEVRDADAFGAGLLGEEVAAPQRPVAEPVRREEREEVPQSRQSPPPAPAKEEREEPEEAFGAGLF